MQKFLLLLLLAGGITGCENHPGSDSEKQAPTTIPCDSFEMEFFDDNGNPYMMKVPCDTTVTE